MTDPAPRRLWAGRTLALLGIILVAANLRTAVTALSPIVTQISVDLPLNAVTIGVLGMLPPVCFAVFGIFTPVLTRRIGLERVLLLALGAIMVGSLVRGLSPSVLVLLLGSVITFAGLGAGNVLLPPLVKKYFPDRIGLVTSIYATMLSVSTLVPPLIAVPVADSAGWRTSLGMWAILSLLAMVPWVAMLVRHRTTLQPTPVIEEADPALLSKIWGSSIAWAITIVFAVSAINAYAMFAWLPQLLIQTAGVSVAEAGTLLSLYAAVGVPTAIFIPVLAARMRNVALLVYLGVICFFVGYGGLILFPMSGTWFWVVIAGIGPLMFPLALVLINLRTRTHAGSVALSGFIQSVGYVLGAFGPLVFGLLHDLTDGWLWPLLFLLATALAAIVAGTVIGRPHLLEDDLARRHR